MRFLESDLEDIIWSNLQDEEGVENLIDRGLEPIYYTRNIYRQLRIGNYGIADIVYGHVFNDKIYVTVVELKKDSINCDSVIQSMRYVKGVRSYLRKRFPKRDVYVDTILIGKSVNTSDWVYLLDYMSNIHVYTYDYRIDGLHFEYEEMNYSLTNEGFNV